MPTDTPSPQPSRNPAAFLTLLAQLVFDPDRRGAHYDLYADDTTEDLVWSAVFWAGDPRAELVRAVLELHRS